MICWNLLLKPLRCFVLETLHRNQKKMQMIDKSLRVYGYMFNAVVLSSLCFCPSLRFFITIWGGGWTNMHLPAQNQNQTLVQKKDPGIESPFFGLGSKIIHLLEVLGSYSYNIESRYSTAPFFVCMANFFFSISRALCHTWEDSPLPGLLIQPTHYNMKKEDKHHICGAHYKIEIYKPYMPPRKDRWLATPMYWFIMAPS